MRLKIESDLVLLCYLKFSIKQWQFLLYLASIADRDGVVYIPVSDIASAMKITERSVYNNLKVFEEYRLLKRCTRNEFNLGGSGKVIAINASAIEGCGWNNPVYKENPYIVFRGMKKVEAYSIFLEEMIKEDKIYGKPLEYAKSILGVAYENQFMTAKQSAALRKLGVRP